MRMELVVRQHHATQIFTAVMYAFVVEMKLAGLIGWPKIDAANFL